MDADFLPDLFVHRERLVMRCRLRVVKVREQEKGMGVWVPRMVKELGDNKRPLLLYRALRSYLWWHDSMMAEYWFDQWVFDVRKFTHILPI